MVKIRSFVVTTFLIFNSAFAVAFPHIDFDIRAELKNIEKTLMAAGSIHSWDRDGDYKAYFDWFENQHWVPMMKRLESLGANGEKLVDLANYCLFLIGNGSDFHEFHETVYPFETKLPDLVKKLQIALQDDSIAAGALFQYPHDYHSNLEFLFDDSEAFNQSVRFLRAARLSYQLSMAAAGFHNDERKSLPLRELIDIGFLGRNDEQHPCRELMYHRYQTSRQVFEDGIVEKQRFALDAVMEAYRCSEYALELSMAVSTDFPRVRRKDIYEEHDLRWETWETVTDHEFYHIYDDKGRQFAADIVRYVNSDPDFFDQDNDDKVYDVAVIGSGLDQVKSRFFQWGKPNNKTSILLISGFPGVLEVFGKLATELRDRGYHVLSIESPARGFSEIAADYEAKWDEVRYLPAKFWGKWLEKVIKTFGLKKVALLGFSTGFFDIGELLYRSQGMAGYEIAAVIGIGPWAPQFSRQKIKEGSDCLLGSTWSIVRNVSTAWSNLFGSVKSGMKAAFDHPKDHKKVIDLLTTSFNTQVRTISFIRFQYEINDNLEDFQNERNVFHLIKTPFLIIAGSKDDIVKASGGSRLYSETVFNGLQAKMGQGVAKKYLIYQGKRHMIPLESPKRLANDLEAFLQALE